MDLIKSEEERRAILGVKPRMHCSDILRKVRETEIQNANHQSATDQPRDTIDVKKAKLDIFKFKRVKHLSKIRLGKFADFKEERGDVIGRVIAVIDSEAKKLSIQFRDHLTDADEKEISFILSLIQRNAPQKIIKFNDKINNAFDPGKFIIY